MGAMGLYLARIPMRNPLHVAPSPLWTSPGNKSLTTAPIFIIIPALQKLTSPCIPDAKGDLWSHPLQKGRRISANKPMMDTNPPT
jgi:hypothetical protein